MAKPNELKYIDQVRDLIRADPTLLDTEIAVKLKCDRGTVRRNRKLLLEAAEIPARAEKPREKSRFYEPIKQVLLTNPTATLAQIGAEVGCGKSTVTTIKEELIADGQIQGSAPTTNVDKRDILDQGRLKENQLRSELYYWKERAGKLDKELTKREAIVEKILVAASRPVHEPKFRIIKTTGRPTRSVVLPLYDCQYGQFVRPQDTPLNLGGFSTAIFDERLERYVEVVDWNLGQKAKENTLTDLTWVLGGDLVEGYDIFAGQAWQLEIDPAQQSLQLSDKLAAAMAYLSAKARALGAKKIMVLGVPGNHGKIGGKKAGATPATYSWDNLTMELIKRNMAEVEIDIWGIEPGGSVLFEVSEHIIHAIHGDEVRGWGGIPYYGLTRYDGRAMRMANVVYDYLLMGHIHQPAQITTGAGGEVIISGDWVGANNLTRPLASASRPQQNILYFSEDLGLTDKVPVFLAPSKGQQKPDIYKV